MFRNHLALLKLQFQYNYTVSSNREIVDLLTEKAQERKINLNQLPQLEIFSMEKTGSEERLEKALGELDIKEVVDEYKDMLEELYFSRNAPHKFQYRTANEIPAYKDFLKELFENRPLWQTGSWVYYPWTNKLIHFLPKDLHNEIRTARNKGLVTHEEQEKFRKFKVGIAGLSIGQSVAYTIAVNGGCEHMHLADMDVISATNTNRIRASFDAIGMSKAVYIARIVYEFNPYAKLKLFTDGLIENNMDNFFNGLDAVIDEVDHFPTKIRIREEAKRRKIPVLMASDIADSVGLDIERYDLDPKQKFFNGKLDAEDIAAVRSSDFDTSVMARIFFKIAGPKIDKRLLESGPLIGTQLAGPPQLGSTAFLSGTTVAYTLRRIAAGENISAGSVRIDLNEHIIKS